MIEERIEDAQQHVARFWTLVRCRTGRIQKFVTGDRTVSFQTFWGPMPKKSSQGTSGSHNRSSSSTQTPSRRTLRFTPCELSWQRKVAKTMRISCRPGSQPGLRNPRLREAACAAHGIRQRSVPETHGCVRTSSRDSLASGGAVLGTA